MADGKFLVIFGLIWSTLTLGVDGFVGYNAWRQWQAETYPSAPGVVTHSEVTWHSDSDGGTTYGVEIRYDYTVNGESFTGDRYRYGQWSSSNSNLARGIVTAHPPGKQVAVFYNPLDPADSVLKTGVESMDLFLALFLTPFNIVMLALWCTALGAWRRKAFKLPAGGVPIVRNDDGVHLRLPRMTPLAAAALTALGISFVSIFIVGFGYSMNPSREVIAVIWGLVLGAAVLVYLWQRFRVGAGLKDLVIDLRRDVFSLPKTFGRDGRAEYPLASVVAVETDEQLRTTSKRRQYPMYCPTIVFRDSAGHERREKLAEWTDAERAHALADWLHQRLVERTRDERGLL